MIGITGTAGISRDYMNKRCQNVSMYVAGIRLIHKNNTTKGIEFSLGVVVFYSTDNQIMQVKENKQMRLIGEL